MEDKSKLLEEIYDKYEEALKDPIQIGQLGSCQYFTLEATAEWALALMKLLGLKQFESLLGITYASRVTDLEEFESGLYESLLEDNNFWQVDGDNPEYDHFIDYIQNKYPEYEKEARQGRLSLAAYMRITEDNAWDLWSAMLGIPLFGEFNVSGYISMPNEDNFEMGIQMAYIMYEWGHELEIFGQFDT